MDTMAASEAPPIEAGAHRPRFWRWATLNERGPRGLADELLAKRGVKVSHQTLWLLMLPWSDNRRPTKVSLELALAIEALTGGEVRADRDWTPPEPAAGGAA